MKMIQTMKTIGELLKAPAILLIVFGVMLVGCNEDDVTVQGVEEVDEELALNEAQLDAIFEDADDMALISLGAEEVESGGRVADEDDRFCENVFSFEGTKSAGTITLDFGEGCVDLWGNVRKGKIIIVFTGGRLVPGSMVTTTFEGYSINDIEIEGTRTLENISETIQDYPKFHITLTGGKVTWPDETFATREVDRTREWINAANPLNDEHHVDGVASGVTRRGVEYAMEITETLIYKRNCRFSRRARIPVQGTKVIEAAKDGILRTITVDFGDGECDSEVTVTVEGRSEDITIG